MSPLTTIRQAAVSALAAGLPTVNVHDSMTVTDEGRLPSMGVYILEGERDDRTIDQGPLDYTATLRLEIVTQDTAGPDTVAATLEDLADQSLSILRLDSPFQAAVEDHWYQQHEMGLEYETGITTGTLTWEYGVEYTNG